MRKITLILIITTVVCAFSYAQQTATKLPQFQLKSSVGGLTREQIIDTLSKVINNSKNKSQLGALYFVRAECYRTTEQFDKAHQDYTSSINFGGQFDLRTAIWNRGLTSESLNNFSAAIVDYRDVLARFPQTDSANKAILYCNIAYDKFRLQQPDSAFYNDSLSLTYSPMYARAFLIRGLGHMQVKKYEQAEIDFTAAITHNTNFSNPKLLSAWYVNLADSKRYNKQYKESINNYSFALKLDPDNRIAYWNRAAAYYKHKDYELATADYSKAITYYTGHNKELSRLYDDRALNEMGGNFLTQAIQDDSLAMTLDPDNKNPYYNLAGIYTQNAEYQKAIDLLKTSLNFQKDNKKLNSFLYYQIANNEYFLGQFDKVIGDCTSAIALDPENSAPYFYRAKVYYKKLDKKDLAAVDFNKVIAMDTTYSSVNYIFSLFFVGRADEALNVLQHEASSTTDEIMLLQDYYNLACLYSLMNKAEEANSYLKMAIDKGYAKKYAIADEDLDNIRNTDDYKAIIGDGK